MFTEMDFIFLFKMLLATIIVTSDFNKMTTGNVISLDRVQCIYHPEKCDQITDKNIPSFTVKSSSIR